MESPPLHVVFGYGQVGPHLVEAVLERGERVRVVKRSPSDVPERAELLTGDAPDARFCREACQGADVVYHCMNPAYDTVTFVVDDSDFREQFDLYATDAQSGAAATVTWARQAYTPS